MICERCGAECDYSPCNGRWCGGHVHTAVGPAKVITSKWHSRAIEKCDCGAYRTLDHSWHIDLRSPTDDQWSEWQRLTETERSS